MTVKSVSGSLGDVYIQNAGQLMVFEGGSWVNIPDPSDIEPKVSSQFMSDENMMEEIRHQVKNNVGKILNIPVHQSECAKLHNAVCTRWNFPEVTVEIAQNFLGEDYFVFKYQGIDIFGDAV